MSTTGTLSRPLLWCLGVAAAVVPTLAQTSRVTPADYARAEKFLAPALNGLVVGGVVAPNWLEGDRFWYRTTLVDGSTQTILVDAARKTRIVCTPAEAACAVFAADAARPSTGSGRAG